MNRRFPGFVAILAFIALIACQCLSGQAFAAENRGHGAPAAALPAELKNVAVQDRFLPAGTREVGLLQTVAAHVVVARNDFSQAYFAANGDKLYEKDVIFTLKASNAGSNSITTTSSPWATTAAWPSKRLPAPGTRPRKNPPSPSRGARPCSTPSASSSTRA